MTERSKPEVWRSIPHVLGYEVSDQGNVRTLRGQGRRTVPENPIPRVLYSYVHRNGYRKVNLYSRGKRSPRWVHRLLLEAFIGPCPEGMEVRHLDGDPSNNTLENLAYGTRSQNMQDMIEHGTHNMRSKTHCIRGHEFTPENTYLRQDTPDMTPRRVCRKCRKLFDERYRRASVSNT